MDSVTQFVLGGAVGEAVLGRKIGNHAILWGGLAGTIPDLDVFIAPLIENPITRLALHRGISHSFFFAFLASFFFAWLTWLVYKRHKSQTNYKDWALLFILGFVTHILLDSFTTWGTQLFLPFSNYRVAFNNIFIVDPLYTIPFLLFLVLTAFFKKDNPWRFRMITTGITISCIYLCFTFIAKFTAYSAFKAELKNDNVQFQRILTAPTPLNTILWYAVAEDMNGYYIGAYSLLDNDKDIDFEYFERNDSLIAGIKDVYEVETLIWMAKGYYVVRKSDEGIVFYDMKYGKRDFENQNGMLKDRIIFPYVITKTDSGVEVVQLDERPSRGEMKEALSQLWTRMVDG